ncbi:hypothetical protein D3OALGA1CA_3736 [Olavius algarvensis associated proteobacterium Delta 3]|nr:hypothetical protein D3OALGA1CA_3736 [Olavius algarvensis associated proteobacterium Delta 3]CAB5149161.1 hypothetical protein D3OALGB2SA_4697 [Olavius algarvensis associated proteobacterium Delta 3]
MKVNLKCFANLAERYTCDYQMTTAMEMNEGSTVSKLMKASGIPEKDVHIVFVNGKISGVQQSLNDGDRITLVPATGGM